MPSSINSRKRRYSDASSTDAGSTKQLKNMPRRTYARARTYGRRGKGRSRTVRRTRRASTPASAIRRVVAQASPAKHILFSDNGVAASNATVFPATDLQNSTPLLQHLTNCTRGTTVQQRIGDITKISKIHLKVRTTYSTPVDGDVIINWMLVREKCNLGYVRTASDFCSQFFGDSTPHTNAIRNSNNSDTAAAWEVLKTGRQYMRGSMSGVIEIRDWSVFWAPKKPKIAKYVRGNAGTPADTDSGGIWLLMYTDWVGLGIKSYIEGNTYFHDA